MTEFLTKDRELELGESIQSYLKIADKYNDETASKEDKEIARKGIAAIDELVSNNMKLVYKIANNFKKRNPSAGEISDLIQDGMVGMMEAVKRYDPKRGNKFSTVAVMWIKQNIGRTSHKTSRLVRLPENRIMQYIKMRAIEEAVIESGGSIAEADLIIQQDIGITQTKINEIRSAAASHASLNKVVGSGDSSREFGEFFEDDKNSSLEDDVLQSQMFTVVDELLAEMVEMEQIVLASSFSLNLPGIPPKTVREVKEEYGLSSSKFNSILNKALSSLKGSMNDLGLDFSDFIS